MRATKLFSWALTLTLLSAASASAEEAFTLGDVRSFGVYEFQKPYLSSERESLPHEIVEYTRSSLQQNNTLPYSSPAQAVLHFHCATESCTWLRVELTHGEDGPVLWQTRQRYRSLLNSWMPDSRKFAQKILSMLAEDYQKALKASPDKIHIPDGI